MTDAVREPGARLLAWGRLLRLSLAPSALADAAAGTILGARAWPEGPAPFLLLGASACVYHGGMALNDWADRAEDARARRGRPLETGAVRAPAALAAALGLLVLGPFLAARAAPRCGLVLLAVALCAVLYDLAGRGALRGPLLLGLCRAGNLAGGLALASTLVPLRPELLAAPLLYGTYVFLVSRVALLEDSPTGLAATVLRPRVAAMAAGLVALGLGAAGLALQASSGVSAIAAAGLVLLGSLALWRAWRELDTGPLRPSDAQRVAGMGLRRLLVASAGLALAAGTREAAWVAGTILCGYPLSRALRRVFPPT